MAPNTSRIGYLTKASYVESSREVVAEFAFLNSKRSYRFAFFPKLFLPRRSIEAPSLKELLSAVGSSRFDLKENNGSLEIVASSFSDLKKLAFLLNSCLKVFPVLLQPERQFLLETDWSFFDAFDLSMPLPRRLKKHFFAPAVVFDFLGSAFNSSLAELSRSDRETAERLASFVALSNLLRVPLNEIPSSDSAQLEIFLENSFYLAGFGFSTAGEKKDFAFSFDSKTPKAAGLEELDFSPAWPALFSRPFFNLGFESLDCDCCKPASIEAKNILPSSTIEASFLADAFYFESAFTDFASRFHEAHSAKDSRLRVQQEWYSAAIPVGPFFAHDTIELPLPDALVLARDGKARLSGKGSLSWFCEKKESFLSSQIRLLNKRLLFFERRLEKLESRATKKHGLFASEILASDPHRVFLGAFSKAISRILYSLPSHLLSSRSRFYSEGLAKAIHSVKAQTLSKFKEFSSTQGSACASLPKYRAAVKPSEALSLSRAFSKKEGIPMPLLAKTTH